MLAVAICFVIKTSQTIYSEQLEHSLPQELLQARPQNQAKLTALPNNIYGQGKQKKKKKNHNFSSFSGRLWQNKHIPCSFQCFISIPEVVLDVVLSELACISHTFQSRVCRRGGRGWGRRYESLAGAGQDWSVERDTTALLADHVLQRPALLRSADHIQRCWTQCTSNMRFQHSINWIILNGRHLGSQCATSQKWHPHFLWWCS